MFIPSSIPSHALVLTAGLGTRLRPLTEVRAKSALPVGGQPLIRRILADLVKAGVTEITMNLHHLPQTLTRVVGDGSDVGARVRYSWEHPHVLGSGGGPRQALDIVVASTFFLINGDTMSDVSLHAVADAHEEAGALVTLALVPNTEYLRYGGVRLAADGAVTGFVRRGPGAAGSFHFFGVQIVSRQAFADIPQGQPMNSIGGVYDRLVAARPGSIRGFVTNARYWDIGTVSDYWNTSREFSPDGANAVGSSAQIAPSAAVTRSVLWDDVVVGDRARLDECIVTDGVRIPDGAAYHRRIVMRTPDGAITTASLTTD